MYNVLIVDDEPTIREGLRTIIDWESQGFSVLDTASNGRDGLQKILELQPDLAIIDIRMPGMTGLEVIEQIRSEKQGTHFLILSGYADFDYAKRAIGYGVDGYLLKPLDEDELIDELQRVGTLLSQEKRHQLRSVEEDLVFRDHVLESFLLEEPGSHPDMILQLGLQWPSYQIVLIDVHEQPEEAALPSLKRKFADRFDRTGQGIAFSVGPFLGVLWSQAVVREEEASRWFKELNAMMPESRRGWHAAAGGAVAQIGQIGKSYAQAAEMLQHRFLFHEERLMVGGDSGKLAEAYPSQEALDHPGEMELANTLYYALDIRSKEAVSRVYDEMKSRIVSYANSEQEIKAAIAQIYSMAMNRLSGSSQELIPLLQNTTPFITDMYRQPTWEQLKELSIKHLGNLIDRIGDSSKDAILKQMIDFIHRNYQENLKLELLAQVFNYNSAYLGKMFKNYTGENFNAFLDRIRIENAKGLLSQGLKVHQVAARVGYANVDYFHSKFKKYVGSSPSSFRKSERTE